MQVHECMILGSLYFLCFTYITGAACVYGLNLRAQPRNDCPDAWWDCLRADDQGNMQQTGGGFAFGTCVAWLHGCKACNPQDVNNATFILEKCNALVPECEERCEWYAELMECCTRPGSHRRILKSNFIGRDHSRRSEDWQICGNLVAPGQRAVACGQA